jgi:hypothetical protein
MISILTWVDSKEDFIIPKPLVMVGLMFSLSLTTNTSSALEVEKNVLLYEEGVVGGGEMLLSFCPTWHSPQSSSASNMLCYGCFSNHFFPCG